MKKKWGKIFSHIDRGKARTFNYLLLSRFVLMNIFGFGVCVILYFLGILDQLFLKESTETWLELLTHPTIQAQSILLAIVVFLAGFVISCRHVFSLSGDLNQLHSLSAALAEGKDVELPQTNSFAFAYLRNIKGKSSGGVDRLKDAFKIRLSHEISVVDYLAGRLVMIALAGTVLGLIIAFLIADENAVSDLSSFKTMFGMVIKGMGIAWHVTMTGIVLSVWLKACYRILLSATVKAFYSTIVLGENLYITKAPA